MKTKAITVAIILGGFSAAISQEYDDVYFKKSDRNKSSQTVVLAKATKASPTVEQTATISQYSSVALPEGYSGRTINPDYQPGGAAVVTTNSSYFKPNYQPTNVNGQLNQYNSYSSNNNYYNNGYYRNGYGYGNYGGYYSPYSSYGYSPYGYGYGSCYTCMGGYSNWGYPSYYGYGSSLGFAMGFGSGYYGGYYGYGSGYGYGGGYYGGYYPSTVVVVNNPDNHVNAVYGKRQSRSTSYAGTSSGRGTALISDPTQGNRGGRVASNSTNNTYYQRGWRQDPAVNQSGGTSSSGSRSSVFNNGSSGTSRSSWSNSGGTSRSSWGNSNSGWGNSTFSGGSRSGGSSFPSGGGSSFGGGRSMGGSSFGGGGGGGHHPSGGGRGRN